MIRFRLPQIVFSLACAVLCTQARAIPPVLLACNKPQVVGGYVFTCEVRFIDSLDAETILDVALHGDIDGVQTPDHIVIEAGQKAVRFQIMTRPVAAPQSVTIEVSNWDGALSTTRKIVPPTVKQLTINHNEVTGGIQATGRVELTGPAPARGAVVYLKSSDEAAALVPSPILIPADLDNATFTIMSKPVTEDKTVLISARAGDEDITSQQTPLLVTQAAKPDLVITDWAFYGPKDEPLAQPLPSKKANLCVNVANISFAKAPPSLLRVIIVGPEGRNFDLAEKVGSFKAGGKERVCLPLPPLEPEMHYTFNLYADSGNAVAESDKSNNHQAFEYSYPRMTAKNTVESDK